MEQLFATQVEGESFELFGIGHLAAIGLLLLAVLSLPLIRKYWDERGKCIFRYSLIVWMVGWEIAWQVWSYYDGSWSIQTHLPLHVCALFSWLSMYMLAAKSYSIYELAYFAGIGGAMQAIFTPDTGGLGFPHFRAYQIFAWRHHPGCNVHDHRGGLSSHAQILQTDHPVGKHLHAVHLLHKHGAGQ
jgi:hypothetical integral membrane protein (TIGR02206 family)